MTVTIVLALATLGGMTWIGSFQFYVALPKVTVAVTGLIVLTLANGNMAYSGIYIGKS